MSNEYFLDGDRRDQRLAASKDLALHLQAKNRLRAGFCDQRLAASKDLARLSKELGICGPSSDQRLAASKDLARHHHQ